MAGLAVVSNRNFDIGNYTKLISRASTKAEYVDIMFKVLERLG